MKSARGPRNKPLMHRGSTAGQALVNRGFCLPIGLLQLSFPRDCEKIFKTVVYDTLKGYWDSSFRGHPTRRQPVLPGSAALCCCAVRHADPDGPRYVRVLDTTGCCCQQKEQGKGSSAVWATSAPTCYTSKPTTCLDNANFTKDEKACLGGDPFSVKCSSRRMQACGLGV